jgi:CheY-like chemotaxis protein
MSTCILVVDDDAEIRNMLDLVLSEEGYRVTTAANGAEALAAIAQETPSVLLLDMQMPVLDGWGVAQCLRKRHESMPTVVMTAGQQAKRVCHELGAQGYVNKPFDFDDLLGVLARVRSQAPASQPSL